MLQLVFAATYTSVGNAIIPLVALALLVDAGIVSLWYMLGSLLNNQGMRASARGEFNQLAGTVVLTILIIALLSTFGNAFMSSLAGTPLAPSAISSMCANIEQGNSGKGLQILSDSAPFTLLGTSTGSAGITGNGDQFPGLCSYATSAAGGQSSLDVSLDYPLVATAIVIANLTNQTATNLDHLFVIDSYVGWIMNIKPTLALCVQAELNEFGPCIIPIEAVGVLMDLKGSFQPAAGYKIPYGSLAILGGLMTSSLELFFAQLVSTAALLYVWPFLLFVGLLLRSTMFTRKIGGLFIAVAIGAIFFYPLIFSLEYLSLGPGLATIVNVGSATSTSSIYGFNSITTNSVFVIPLDNKSDFPLQSYVLTGNYMPNFYVQPNLRDVANYYGYWPAGGDASGTIAEMFISTALYVIPFSAIVSDLLPLLRASGFVPSSIPLPSTLYPPTLPNNLESMAFTMLNAYGLIGITSYFLPILNLIITLTGIIGLSGLLGGDTSLGGLAKII